MNILVNGDIRKVPAGYTLALLLDDLAINPTRIAIEINEEIVPRSTHPDHVLQNGDKVEVVTAIGGG